MKYVFNKSMIINELEQAQIAMNSQGVISKKTIVANHPWVTDVEQEMTDLEKEQEDEYKRMDEQLGKVGEEDGNTGTDRPVPGQSN